MMVSEVKYPSFKTLDLRARRTFAKTVVFHHFRRQPVSSCANVILPVVLPLIFTLYLIYGFIRPRISRKVRHEIEEEEDEEGGGPTP